jgi:ABC-type transport system involved in Fe-S cluster assembly fused permease/ATPase subunit
VIGPRLSTVLSADVILVFNGGRVVEQGNHSELVLRGVLDAELYPRQFLSGRAELDASELVTAGV